MRNAPLRTRCGLISGWAGCPGSCCATRLCRIEVPAVTSARRIGEVRERCTIGKIIDIDAIAQAIIREDVESRIEHACNCPQGYIDYIVEQATSVRITGGISAEHPQPVRKRRRCRRHASVEPQQVGNRTCRCSRGGNRRRTMSELKGSVPNGCSRTLKVEKSSEPIVQLKPAPR